MTLSFRSAETHDQKQEFAMQFRATRSGFVLACLVSFVSSQGCSCGDDGLPGPGHRGFTTVTASTVAAIGVTPFDVDRQDLSGPNTHDSQYGKTPEIVAAPGPGYIDVVLRSNDAEEDGPRAFYLRITDTGGTLSIGQVMEVPSLGVLMGFARAADGTFYYATGVYDDDVDANYPADDARRTNVVHVYHFDSSGHTLFDIDLDTARQDTFPNAESIVNPGVAASSRLAVNDNVVALVHGNNTNPDPNINGTRHQKALATYLDATDGTIRAASGIWMSHSFDQRYTLDGDDIIEMHLGDAYDRAIMFSRITNADADNGTEIYVPKGDTGANNTFTRLGDIVTTSTPGTMLAILATERTTGTMERVEGSRDLGLVRVVANELDDSFGTSFTVPFNDETATNHVLFLTNYHGTAPGVGHAERPKLIPIGSNQYIALWEHWTYVAAPSGMQMFEGTYAMRIDASGAILAPAMRVSDHHLPRGDDAFAYGGGAAWITGDQQTFALTLHMVAPNLGITETVLP
jgi:hypothetical protein